MTKASESFCLYARINGEIFWWCGFAWDENPGKALYMTEAAANRQAGILRTNNRWLDREDQADIYITESK